MKIMRRKSVVIAHSRWAPYAVAGAATSLTGMATAEAEVHYSGPVNFHFNGTLNHQFPLDNGAAMSFFHIDEGGGFGYAHMRIPDPAGGLFQSIGRFAGLGIGSEGSYFYLSRLPSQEEVSQLHLGNSCRSTSSSGVNCYGGIIGFPHGSNGNFREPGRGYIAFSFDAGAGTEYGWVRIKTTGVPAYNFIVLDYAWADPGESIATGQKRSQRTVSAVSKSGSLGLLATGAVGVSALRKERFTAAH